jgi:hypothetical protein
MFRSDLGDGFDLCEGFQDNLCLESRRVLFSGVAHGGSFHLNFDRFTVLIYGTIIDKDKFHFVAPELVLGNSDSQVRSLTLRCFLFSGLV